MKVKNPIRPLLTGLAAFAVYLIPMLVGHIYDIRHPVTTLAGHDALVQIHGYLRCLLIRLAAIPFASALAGFVGSLIYRAGNADYKGERRWSPAAVIVIAVVATAEMLFIPKVSGLDLQQKLNGFKGLPIVQIARLYNACGKDIESGEVIAKEIENAETGYEIFSYYKGSGSGRRGFTKGYTTQHSLNSGGEPLAQISASDERRLEILLMTSDSHSAELYKNSGFIASFDGYDMIPSDFSTLFTIERDGEYVLLPEAEKVGKLAEVKIYAEHDGKEICNLPVGSNTDFYFPRMEKGTICYLRVWFGGEYLRVSNIVEF